MRKRTALFLGRSVDLPPPAWRRPPIGTGAGVPGTGALAMRRLGGSYPTRAARCAVGRVREVVLAQSEPRNTRPAPRPAAC